MTAFVAFREQLKLIYSRYDFYITAAMKFFLAFISLIVVNSKLGYMERLKSMPIVLLLSLMCAFMPANAIILVTAIFVILHVYSLSLECAIVVAAMFVIMFLLYFRFSPREAISVILTPICFALKIPFVMPIALGLTGTPSSGVAVGCGAIVYYVLRYLSDGVTTLNSIEAENAIQKYRYAVDGIINNKTMMVVAVVFAFTVCLVYTVRRLSIDYAWDIAIVSGALGCIIFLFIGNIIVHIEISALGAILEAIVSIVICKGLEMLVFHVDYSRSERMQFEDDEYYYYVKAVPKITVPKRNNTVKKIAHKTVNHSNTKNVRVPASAHSAEK